MQTMLPLPLIAAPVLQAPKPMPKRHPLEYTPKEFKVISLRECPTPSAVQLCDTPERAAEYWGMHLPSHPYFNPDVECLAVLFLNTRRRVKGHHLVSTGILDTLLAHPRECFRAAIVMAASAVVFMHNHPSGDPSPSEADIKVTRDFIRAGQLLKIDVLDHVVVGQAMPDRPKGYCSLRELGYF